jgi:hypothetical protein
MTYDPFDTSEDESTADGSLAVSDLELDGTVTGITDVEVIDSRTDESSLPAVAAPQIQYVESTDSYRKSYGLEGRTMQGQFRTGTTSSQGSPERGCRRAILQLLRVYSRNSPRRTE